MIDPPVTRFAERDGISLAYQVFGDGDFDLLFARGGVSHVDLAYRRYSRFMQRLGSFARVTVFDKRGMGASDPGLRPPTLEERMADIAIHVGARNAALELKGLATEWRLYSLAWAR